MMLLLWWLLTIDDGTDDLDARVSEKESAEASTQPPYLVNLAITDTASAGESAVDRESERSRADNTRSRGREGRASRAGEGGNAAIRGQVSVVPQLAPVAPY